MNNSNPTTWRRGDREAEAFTNVDGDSMVFVPWNDTKVLLHNDRELSLSAAEELAATTNSRERLNMKNWTLCFALDDDEENEYYPCGGGVEDWMESKK
jgi:hypothetical protein